MNIRVEHYAGACMADPEGLRGVAQQVARTYREGHNVVVVVNAMDSTTDELLRLAGEVSPEPHETELDVLRTAGELISTSLLAMAIGQLGVPAMALTAGQGDTVGIDGDRARRALASGVVVVVAGLGANAGAGAVAAALSAEGYEVGTPGPATADRRVDALRRPAPAGAAAQT